MAEGSTPLFHNDVGARRVRIGAKEFMCMGASPPFDHPHEFQIGRASCRERVCQYV